MSVSTNIIRTLLERNWIRVVGHRDVPGRPEMFGTTREFLDYFGLRKLDELPSLAELRDLDSLNVELDLGMPGEETQEPRQAPGQSSPDEAAEDDAWEQAEPTVAGDEPETRDSTEAEEEIPAAEDIPRRA